MRIVICTGNAIRHKFVANSLAEEAEETLVAVESFPHDAADIKMDAPSSLTPQERHFRDRHMTETQFFSQHDRLRPASLPILRGELNQTFVYDTVKKFAPDAIFIFGSSIIKAPLLSLLPAGRSINLHLGISPYYRGAGTNFWPFVNNELEYVGATLLHIDAGIDTGDIITHVRPRFSADDTVHTVGCKVIAESAYMLIEVLRRLRSGEKLPRVPQWSSTGQRYYRKRDFNEAALKKYHENMQRGIVKEFIAAKERAIQLVQPFNSPARFPSPPLAIS